MKRVLLLGMCCAQQQAKVVGATVVEKTDGRFSQQMCSELFSLYCDDHHK
jgi:hypothetical protein